MTQSIERNNEGVRYATTADEQVWQLEAARSPPEKLRQVVGLSEEWSFSVCETNPGDGIFILVNAINSAWNTISTALSNLVMPMIRSFA